MPRHLEEPIISFFFVHGDSRQIRVARSTAAKSTSFGGT
jgi:hypothetical protein